MPRNTGKGSEKRFEDLVKLHYGKDAMVFELTDTSEVKGLSKGAGIAKEQPSDYIAVIEGDMHLAEVKSTSGSRFKKSLIRRGQIKWAKLTVAAGGEYFFYVHNLTDELWYRVPAKFILNSEAKSWTWEELSQFEWRFH